MKTFTVADVMRKLDGMGYNAIGDDFNTSRAVAKAILDLAEAPYYEVNDEKNFVRGGEFRFLAPKGGRK